MASANDYKLIDYLPRESKRVEEHVNLLDWIISCQPINQCLADTILLDVYPINIVVYFYIILRITIFQGYLPNIFIAVDRFDQGNEQCQYLVRVCEGSCFCLNNYLTTN